MDIARPAPRFYTFKFPEPDARDRRDWDDLYQEAVPEDRRRRRRRGGQLVHRPRGARARGGGDRPRRARRAPREGRGDLPLRGHRGPHDPRVQRQHPPRRLHRDRERRARREAGDRGAQELRPGLRRGRRRRREEPPDGDPGRDQDRPEQDQGRVLAPIGRATKPSSACSSRNQSRLWFACRIFTHRMWMDTRPSPSPAYRSWIAPSARKSSWYGNGGASFADSSISTAVTPSPRRNVKKWNRSVRGSFSWARAYREFSGS